MKHLGLIIGAIVGSIGAAITLYLVFAMQTAMDHSGIIMSKGSLLGGFGG